MPFKNKTILITGASRGIGKAIALKLAGSGANIAILAKSVTEDPRLGGTIYNTADDVTAAGGKALPIACDVRDEEQIIKAVQQTVALFGGIDIVINNASAISLSPTLYTEAKRFDLMHDINVRGTFLVTKHCILFLQKAENAHILTLSPPLNMSSQWIAMSVAYAMSKYNMSMMAKAWAQEFKSDAIASNALWPATTIATAAIKNLVGGDDMMQRSRNTDIIADAVHYILQQPSNTCTGNTFLDEEVLNMAGITDFSKYAIDPTAELQRDLFID